MTHAQANVCRSSLYLVSGYKKLTNVGHVQKRLVVDDGLVSGAQLDGVGGPDGGVVFIEEALVGPLAAVVRTLSPLLGGAVGVSEDKVRSGCETQEPHSQIHSNPTQAPDFLLM